MPEAAAPTPARCPPAVGDSSVRLTEDGNAVGADARSWTKWWVRTCPHTHLTFGGVTIGRAAGADDSKKPAEWRRQPTTVALVEFLEESVMGKSHNEWFRAVTGGPDQGTLAHWQIGMAYAKYLSPECNSVVRAHMLGRRPLLRPPSLFQKAGAVFSIWRFSWKRRRLGSFLRREHCCPRWTGTKNRDWLRPSFSATPRAISSRSPTRSRTSGA